ncbi:MAG: hypothetical protein WCX12_02215 [Candidatus Paceibacterota bacterium]|jgi:type II secretory pathway pseudopilin PulG
MYQVSRFENKRGFGLIDVIVSIGIIAVLFGGIFLVYFSILDLVNNIESRTAASEVLNGQIEVIRNLAYSDVGLQGGAPAGVIPQQKTLQNGDFIFVVNTVIRNIDDPFDGTLGSNPNDTSPADYKLVEFKISCPNCKKFVPLSMTTTVAPKNLEGASTAGSLFVNVFDANGLPVPEASVHVVNSIVAPTINLTDATNNNGILQLVGVPTSSQSYQIDVSKSGYSAEKTYAIGDPLNPNPVKPHATVAVGQVTQISFAIDKLGAIRTRTSDYLCVPIANKNFSVKGSKLIGTTPDVYKFSTSSTTGIDGEKIINGVEWDNYSFTLADTGSDILGTIPFTPANLSPSSTLDFRFVLRPAAPESLLVTVKDAATGAILPEATVTLSKAGFSKTLITGHNYLTQTDWSSSNYDSQDGGVETEAVPGRITLTQNGGIYSTTTISWLVSKTFDLGGSSSTFYSISWSPTSQPAQTGAGSLQIQLAANNDNVTWSFIGPDGTDDTFYTISSSTINQIHNGNRYLRYRVYMQTDDENFTPQLNDLTIEFNGVCVPLSQVLFNNLSAGDYMITVNANGYTEGSSSVAISGNWQQIEVLMYH